jgi:parallel beta-helix repeat protein
MKIIRKITSLLKIALVITVVLAFILPSSAMVANKIESMTPDDKSVMQELTVESDKKTTQGDSISLDEKTFGSPSQQTQLEGDKSGVVIYPVGSDLLTAQNADYIIIAAETLWNARNTDGIVDLANHRASYNNWDIAVVNVADIYSYFSGSELDDKIKSFITHAYYNWHAPNMGDGHTGFVVLVGNARESFDYLPTHMSTKYVNDEQIATDWWYSCINDDNQDGLVNDDDRYADLLIGRLPAGSASQCQSIINKIISYENSGASSWKQKIGLYSGYGRGEDLAKLRELHDEVFPYIQDLADENSFFYISETELLLHYTESIDFKNQFITKFNQGRGIILVASHGEFDRWEWYDEPGDSAPFLSSDVDDLENIGKTPIIISGACSVAEFNHMGTKGPDSALSLGETFVLEESKGSVAFFGSSRASWHGDSFPYHKKLFSYILEHGVNNIGIAIYHTKLDCYPGGHYPDLTYNLLGDPGLSIYGMASVAVTDLKITNSDIQIIPNGGNKIITATVHNAGIIGASGVEVNFYEGDPTDGGTLIETVEIDVISRGEEVTPQIIWTPQPDVSEIYVVVDPSNEIGEVNETNNMAFASLDIESPTIDEWISIPEEGTAGGSVYVSLTVTDNVGVTVYTITVDWTTYTMNKNGNTYSYTINIPGCQTSNIIYSCYFADAAENYVTTDDIEIIVTPLPPNSIINQRTGETFSSIQAAIDAALTGDTLYVSDGVYSEPNGVNFNGKALVLQSVNGPQATTIDATGGFDTSTVIFENSEGRDTVLNGFTITGGQGTDGGGISCIYSSPTIINNVIAGNTAPYRGGGIYLTTYSDPLIKNNIIRDNIAEAVWGGGISTFGRHDDLIITNNIITGNTANENYPIAGIMLYQSGTGSVHVTITNNIIADNHGSGLGCKLHQLSSWSDVTITNNIITNNRKGGIHDLWSAFDPPSQAFAYNDVWNNYHGDYIGLPPMTNQNGNIAKDPRFFGTGEYRFWPNSPCKDAGDPDPAYNDIDGTRNDMGVYGGPHGAILSFNYGDVNGDGSVSNLDANLILQYTEGSHTFTTAREYLAADVNLDCTITQTDAQIIIDYLAGQTTLPNPHPVIIPIGSQTFPAVIKGHVLIDIHVSDPGDSHNLRSFCSELPPWLTFTDKGNGNGEIKGRVCTNQPALWQITIAVTDGYSSDAETFILRYTDGSDEVPPPPADR